MMEPKQTIQVWLVEDNDTYRRGVARAINASEHLACERQFVSVEALFTALREGDDPDVILLDVQLPGMDGISGLTEIRELDRSIRTVILTAFDDTEKIFRAVCAGASGYLLKSASKGAIEMAIHDAHDGGAPMTPSVAKKVLELFANANRSKHETRQYHLTAREKEVLRLMADGLIKKEIATALDNSVHTVNTHIRNIYDKLHVNTNTGAVAKALREDLI